jgi:transcriptional regulator with XRE-family HTH domain
MARRLTSYGEVLDVLTGLRAAVIEGRRREGLTLRDLAAISGTSINGLSRFERGVGDIQLATALKLIAWLSGRPSGGDGNG